MVLIMSIKGTLKRVIAKSRILSLLYDKIYYPYVLWKRCKLSIGIMDHAIM